MKVPPPVTVLAVVASAEVRVCGLDRHWFYGLTPDLSHNSANQAGLKIVNEKPQEAVYLFR